MFIRQVAAFAACLLLASPALADCKSSCSVGAVGKGGQQSDGKARGFRYVGPGPLNPNFTLTNDGRASEGHVEVLDADGNVIGVLNGRCEAGTFIWNGTGSGIFGDWTGSSEIDFLPCD
jgi:hypothetical protein